MIKFRDFAPAERRKSDEDASFRDSASEASRWIDAEDINVVNIETVVLPSRVLLGTSLPPTQIVRVWHRT